MMTKFRIQLKNPALMLMLLQSVVLLAAALLAILVPLQ